MKVILTALTFLMKTEYYLMIQFLNSSPLRYRKVFLIYIIPFATLLSFLQFFCDFTTGHVMSLYWLYMAASIHFHSITFKTMCTCLVEQKRKKFYHLGNQKSLVHRFTSFNRVYSHLWLGKFWPLTCRESTVG